MIVICFKIIFLFISVGISQSAGLQTGLDANESSDDTIALREWTALAEQGNLAAQVRLGDIYRYGRGVQRNYRTAVKWYTQAAEQGCTVAQFGLGNMYKNGQGIARDDVYAYMWLNLAASGGDPKVFELKNELAERMTAAQIVQAQKRAHECAGRNYRGCTE